MRRLFPFLLTALGPCCVRSYDKSDNSITDKTIEEIVQSTGRVVTTGEGLCIYWDEKKVSPGSFIMSGSGLFLEDSQSGESYFLTNSHALPDEDKYLLGDCIPKSFETKVLEANTEVVKRDKEKDLALLRLDRQYAHPYKGKIVERAEIGDFVFNYGFPGKISPFGMLGEGRVSADIGTYTFLYLGVNEGQSGGPLFVFDRGHPVLAGLVCGRFPDGQSLGIAISSKAIKEFLEGTFLEDEYGH